MVINKEMKNASARKINKAMEMNLKYNEKKWRIIKIYSRQTIKEMMESIKDEVKEEEEEYLIIDDFKARN